MPTSIKNRCGKFISLRVYQIFVPLMSSAIWKGNQPNLCFLMAACIFQKVNSPMQYHKKLIFHHRSYPFIYTNNIAIGRLLVETIKYAIYETGGRQAKLCHSPPPLTCIQNLPRFCPMSIYLDFMALERERSVCFVIAFVGRLGNGSNGQIPKIQLETTTPQ